MLTPLEFICVNILLGLKYIHDQGFIHRDLCPENLVFDKNNYLTIIDFGNCSKRYDYKYQTSLRYSAPELVFNQKY